jgi:hypothetical protein
LPPAFDHTVRAANNRELTPDNPGSQNGRERLTGPGARPIANAFPLPDANGEVSLHEIRGLRFAVNLESVADRNGEVFRKAIFI